MPIQEHNLDAALKSFLKRREDQFNIRYLIAVPLKKHMMWNPTIPQDKKFSTVISLLQNFQIHIIFKPDTEKQTLVDWFTRSGK